MNIIKALLKNPKIGIICVAVLAVSMVSFLLAYLVKPQEWSWASLFLNLAIALLQLFLAIIIVEGYLDYKERKRKEDLKKSRTVMIYNTVLEPGQVFNEHFNNIIAGFGIDRYDNIIEKCQQDNKYPDKMPQADIDEFINAIKPQYEKLLCEVNNTAGLFKIVISSGVLNDDPSHYGDFIVALRSCIHLNNLDINSPADYRLIFKENAVFYGKVYRIVISLHDEAKE